jgi:hypothetical protein
MVTYYRRLGRYTTLYYGRIIETNLTGDRIRFELISKSDAMRLFSQARAMQEITESLKKE